MKATTLKQAKKQWEKELVKRINTSLDRVDGVLGGVVTLPAPTSPNSAMFKIIAKVVRRFKKAGWIIAQRPVTYEKGQSDIALILSDHSLDIATPEVATPEDANED